MSTDYTDLHRLIIFNVHELNRFLIYKVIQRAFGTFRLVGVVVRFNFGKVELNANSNIITFVGQK